MSNYVCVFDKKLSNSLMILDVILPLFNFHMSWFRLCQRKRVIEIIRSPLLKFSNIVRIKFNLAVVKCPISSDRNEIDRIVYTFQLCAHLLPNNL